MSKTHVFPKPFFPQPFLNLMPFLSQPFSTEPFSLQPCLFLRQFSTQHFSKQAFLLTWCRLTWCLLFWSHFPSNVSLEAISRFNLMPFFMRQLSSEHFSAEHFSSAVSTYLRPFLHNTICYVFLTPVSCSHISPQLFQPQLKPTTLWISSQPFLKQVFPLPHFHHHRLKKKNTIQQNNMIWYVIPVLFPMQVLTESL